MKSTSDKNQTVYVVNTDYGEKYHSTEGCVPLLKTWNTKEVPIMKAWNDGFRPCKRCSPPSFEPKPD
jgi:hypothetical protein